MSSKLFKLSNAAGMIADGQCLALGGNTLHRFPGAFVRELARQRRKDLTLIKTAGSYDIDLLCLSESVQAVHAGYVGFESEFGLAPNYRRAVENGQVQALEHTCYSVIAAMRAASFGVPFLPMAGLLGSDLLKYRDFKVIKDPFGSDEEVALIPGIQPDWAIIHVHEADEQGNGRIIGTQFEDVLMTRAAKGTILTAERIVDTDTFKQNPDQVQIPAFMVKAVVEAANGAFPGSCFPLYDYDAKAIRYYLRLKPESLGQYLTEMDL